MEDSYYKWERAIQMLSKVILFEKLVEIKKNRLGDTYEANFLKIIALKKIF